MRVHIAVPPDGAAPVRSTLNHGYENAAGEAAMWGSRAARDASEMQAKSMQNRPRGCGGAPFARPLDANARACFTDARMPYVRGALRNAVREFVEPQICVAIIRRLFSMFRTKAVNDHASWASASVN